MPRERWLQESKLQPSELLEDSMMKYFKNIRITLTPLNILLLTAVIIGMLYTATYLIRIVMGVSIPFVSDAYIEDQVKSSFEASKFSAKIEDPKIEKNLFHPERKTLKRVALVSDMAGNPQFVLSGTFISPGLQMAYLEDNGNPQMSGSGERRQQALKKGDMISGFVLQEIYPDKVMLLRNGEKIFVRLSENKTVRENTEKLPKTPQTQANQPPAKSPLQPQSQPRPLPLPPPPPVEENN